MQIYLPKYQYIKWHFCKNCHVLKNFYEKTFSLSNIEVVGIGTNLSCMYGVLPSHDKLIQLGIYKQLIEAKFNKSIKYLSGGTSVTIPLIFQNLLPKGINHFRVGETLFLGTDVYNDSVIKGMQVNLFQFYAQIIELKEKPSQPIGEMGTNLVGHVFEFSADKTSYKSYRALLDVGLLDVDQQHITPKDTDIQIVGVSSDVTVADLGENKKGYKTGDFIEFKMDYTGTLKILNSRYIDKIVNNTHK